MQIALSLQYQVPGSAEAFDVAGALGQHELVAMVVECSGDPIAVRKPVEASVVIAQGRRVVRSLVAGPFG